MFFTMCEMAMLGTSNASTSKQPIVNGLSSLLFYTVFGYFVTKMREICETHISSVNMNYGSTSYLKWILKIILEWAKAIGIVLCVKDRGVMMHTNPLYAATTFSYYLSTEKLFVDLFIRLVSKLKLQSLEEMEHLYVPIAFNSFALFLSVIVTLSLRTPSHLNYAMFASYFTLYMRTKLLYVNYIHVMKMERQTFASFRYASESDLKKWNDICAVCLNRMTTAKITPCNHLFHPACLRECLKISLQCPLCKQEFVQQ